MAVHLSEGTIVRCVGVDDEADMGYHHLKAAGITVGADYPICLDANGESYFLDDLGDYNYSTYSSEVVFKIVTIH